eukprot:scaffold7082_cov350-Prasinococcus_capsulatus_cf.AAC.4
MAAEPALGRAGAARRKALHTPRLPFPPGGAQDGPRGAHRCAARILMLRGALKRRRARPAGPGGGPRARSRSCAAPGPVQTSAALSLPPPPRCRARGSDLQQRLPPRAPTYLRAGPGAPRGPLRVGAGRRGGGVKVVAVRGPPRLARPPQLPHSPGWRASEALRSPMFSWEASRPPPASVGAAEAEAAAAGRARLHELAAAEGRHVCKLPGLYPSAPPMPTARPQRLRYLRGFPVLLGKDGEEDEEEEKRQSTKPRAAQDSGPILSWVTPPACAGDEDGSEASETTSAQRPPNVMADGLAPRPGATLPAPRAAQVPLWLAAGNKVR